MSRRVGSKIEPITSSGRNTDSMAQVSAGDSRRSVSPMVETFAICTHRSSLPRMATYKAPRAETSHGRRILALGRRRTPAGASQARTCRRPYSRESAADASSNDSRAAAAFESPLTVQGGPALSDRTPRYRRHDKNRLRLSLLAFWSSLRLCRVGLPVSVRDDRWCQPRKRVGATQRATKKRAPPSAR